MTQPTDDVSVQLSSGRHGLSREAVAASQRKRIIEAMVAAVAQRGYAATRVVDVIARAGVSRRTFYELFRDKEQCFLAAYDEVFGRLVADTSDAFESAAGQAWSERIRAAMTALLVGLADDPAAARFSIVEVFVVGARAVARRDAALRRLGDLVDAGRSESSLELPGITGKAIIGGINELLYADIRAGAAAELPSRLPDIIFWITEPFLGIAGAGRERDRAREQLPERV